eukprot:gene15864-18813_t
MNADVCLNARWCELEHGLAQAAIELVEACECEEPSGCPACIHYLDCSEYNNVLDKSSALLVLKATVDAE